MMRKHLREQDITAIVDRREQRPLDLSPLKTIEGTLQTGDYSLLGLEHIVSCERKSLVDCIACCGRDRERFEREIERLLAFPVRLLVVETSWREIERGQWRSQLKPAHVTGSLLAWQSMGLPVLLSGTHQRAGRLVARLLFISARKRYRELIQLGNLTGG